MDQRAKSAFDSLIQMMSSSVDNDTIISWLIDAVEQLIATFEDRSSAISSLIDNNPEHTRDELIVDAVLKAQYSSTKIAQLIEAFRRVEEHERRNEFSAQLQFEHCPVCSEREAEEERKRWA